MFTLFTRAEPATREPGVPHRQPDPEATSLVVYGAAGLVLLLLAGAALLPVAAPWAAGPDEVPTEGAASAAAGAPSFGAATPTEKFVQSFQQQVSQQLQSALAQSNEAQENRLRSYEKQQKDLAGQIQSMEQTLVQARTAGPSGESAMHGPWSMGQDAQEAEPPHVNARRPSPSEAAGAADANVPWPAAPGGFAGSVAEGGGGADALGRYGDFKGNALSDESAAGSHANPAARSRPGDANVAPHGFVEGRLLNGVVAIQGGADRDSVVALSGNYQSANGFTTDLDGCFALVQGKPEIATGRIDFKLSRLTCNFPDGASRTWDASGWLVDGDGIRGVRATIVDNTARKAAVAAGGGAIGGLGQRISQQQYQINNGPAGFGSSTTFTGSPASDALGGAASGAANALGQSINDYYNLYAPSLQIGGGTRVTVVLANDLRLPSSGRSLTQTHVATP